MKTQYCVACDIENKKVKATKVVDNVPLCDTHSKIYSIELDPIIHEDKSNKKE